MSTLTNNFSLRWLSVDEIAKYLGVVEETIYRWIDQRRMPAHRVGKLWKFKMDEVDKWVQSGGSASSSPINSSIKYKPSEERKISKAFKKYVRT